MPRSPSDAIRRLFETVSLGSPRHAIGFVLWRVVHRYQREIDRALLPLDLTHLQFTTLMLVAWMGRDGEPTTQAEISRFGDIHPMQISNVLRALDEKGMVVRMPDPARASAKHVAITKRGVAVLTRAIPLAIDVQRALFGDDGAPGGPLLETLARIDGSTREVM